MDSLALAFAGPLGLLWRRSLTLALRQSPRLVWRAARGSTGFDLAAVLQLVLAINDHRVSGLHSAADAHGIPRRKGHSDRDYFHRVVWLRCKDVRALRPALNRRVPLGLSRKSTVSSEPGGWRAANRRLASPAFAAMCRSPRALAVRDLSGSDACVF